MRKRRHRSENDTGINMTPMLDIVFIMLIFFIVTAAFVKESGLETSAPAPSDSASQLQAQIRVLIDERDEVWIDGRRVDIRAVRANIERLHAENPGSVVLIEPTESSSAGTLVHVLDQVRLSKVPVTIAGSR